MLRRPTPELGLVPLPGDGFERGCGGSRGSLLCKPLLSRGVFAGSEELFRRVPRFTRFTERRDRIDADRQQFLLAEIAVSKTPVT